MEIRVAVDAMGGDLGPAAVVPAILSVLKDDPQLSVDVFGDERTLAGMIDSAGLCVSGENRFQQHHADEAVAMSDAPVAALRQKTRSSMRLALEHLAAGKAQACISCGNTGALVLISHQVLGLAEGIDRPALATLVPTPQGSSVLLDVGANIEASPGLLLQHARLGVQFAAALGIQQPSLGLLNVGVEAGKGPAAVQETNRLLRELDFCDYRGFVEGTDLFAGKVDVILTDGFSGNVALKSSESAARLIASQLGQRQDQPTALSSGFRSLLDPESFNGACLLGLQGIVVKGHGASTERGVAQSLRLAARLARSSIIGN